MMVLIAVLAGIPLLLFLLLHIACIIAFFFPEKLVPSREHSIDVLIAARNEERNISRLLESLARLDYPAEKINFHIGDDQSEDRTGELVRNFTSGRSNFHYHLIPEGRTLRGKQHVLATLAEKSNADLILFTDADIEVKPTWAAVMAGSFRQETGVTGAVTIVKGKDLFGKVQELDWMYWMSLAASLARLNIPITCCGNNMAVSRKAYRESGGYAAMPFSVTEDYKLFDLITRKKGFGFRWVNSRDTLNYSAPVDSLGTLVNQRLRWMAGGKEVAWHSYLVMLLYGLWLPCLLVFALVQPFSQVLFFLLGTAIMHLLLTLLTAIRYGRIKSFLCFPFFQLFFISSLVLIPGWSLFDRTFIWKGRKYEMD